MNHIGQNQIVIIGGIKYRLSRFTRAKVRKWLDWAKGMLPNPIPGFNVLNGFSPKLQELILDEALAILKARQDLNSPDILPLWNSEAGLRQMFLLLAEPSFDESLYPQVRANYDVRKLILKATGQTVPDEGDIQHAYLVELGLIEERTTPSKPIDWEDIDKNLFEQFHLTPAQIDEMTLTELSVICNQRKPGISMEQAIHEARLYYSLTHEQRLELSFRQLSALNAK